MLELDDEGILQKLKFSYLEHAHLASVMQPLSTSAISVVL